MVRVDLAPGTPLSSRAVPTPLGLGALVDDLAPINLPASIAPALDGDRRLPPLVPTESRARRWTFLLIAIGIVCLYFYASDAYWAPAHPGVDQNGYQVGGRLFARTFSTGMKPPNEYTYIGWMWVRNVGEHADGWYYPKYPLGVPVLDAACLWAGELLHGDGVAWAYRVSPVCAAATLLAIFLMTRMAAGSYAGLLATILLATSPVLLVMTNNPNSHPPGVAFATWGILWLMWWWRHGGWWRGAIAGFLLGYAVTIRYTEGLLLLPLATVCALTIRWRNPRSYLRAAVPVLAWLVPVLLLVLFNKFAMGNWTGYDTTNESTGFTWANFVEKWEQTLNQLHGTALFFIFPLSIFGLVLMYRWQWRVALLMTLWFVPGVLIYNSYYWGADLRGLAYLRFFATLLPPMIVCAAWLMHHAGERLSSTPSGAPDREPSMKRTVLATLCAAAAGAICFGALHMAKTAPMPATIAFFVVLAALVAALPFATGGVAARVAAGFIVAIAAAVSVYDNIGALERDYALSMNLADLGDRVRAHVPDEYDPTKRAILFGDSRPIMSGLNYLQFRGNYECYGMDVFTAAYGKRMSGGNDPDAPNPLQAARREHLRDVYKDKTDASLQAEGQKILTDAIAANRRVFAALPKSSMGVFKTRMIAPGYEAVVLDHWREPVEMTADAKKALANFGFGAQLIMGRGQTVDWQLVEVRKKS
jgi:4-amino-4-deoxy-L-arabinose transferase-like glycosyltransferase